MSEQETKRCALVPYTASAPARVQVAAKQLAIAARLKHDIERKRLVDMLKRISYEEIVAFLTLKQTLDGDLMERFADHLFWGYGSQNDFAGLSSNEDLALPWSEDLLERFADRWDWGLLSGNAALPWSLDLIERFEDRWDWLPLSNNTRHHWSPELIERFADRWDWGFHHFGGGLSGNTALPWSLELINRFADAGAGRDSRRILIYPGRKR